MSQDRLTSAGLIVVRIARVANMLFAVAAIAAVTASFAAAPLLEARLLAKYGPAANISAILNFMRVLMLSSLGAVYVIERLLRALADILRSVARGDPFARANGGRLRTIGWMLLALQLLDLAGGGATLIARRLHIDFATWQPSFTGWFAVLIAFVLVRVFAAGADLSDDLEGTV